MRATLTAICEHIDFIPKEPGKIITAYQCAGESRLRPERFLIYYGLFRGSDKNPTPDLIGKWGIKIKIPEKGGGKR